MDSALNLVSACAFCHGKYQADRQACFEKIAEREGLESAAVVQEAIWRLLRTPKEKR
jgi:hypothetical protein